MELPTVTKKVLLTLLVLVLGFIFGFPLKIAERSDAGGVELLVSPWHLSALAEAVETYHEIDENILLGKTGLELTFNLNGTCILDGDASAVIFDQDGWKMIELSNYGENCKEGNQTVVVPLNDFRDINTKEVLDINKPLTGLFHVRFWYFEPYTIDILSAILKGGVQDNTVGEVVKDDVDNAVSETPVLILPPTEPVHTPFQLAGGWQIRSVDAMKDTKDAICNQRPRSWIERFVDMTVELGANYIAISTPYENPPCGDAGQYTKLWIEVIRSRGVKVWHRQMPLAFENIYNAGKHTGGRNLDIVANYIKANRENYREGDIVTPIPEPQNGGISGITHCAYGHCQFASSADFNSWLREAMNKTNSALTDIGLGGKVGVGYFGFDGFVAWGANNPDWNGILEDETVRLMGNITIDHYPEAIGSTMEQGLNELETRYPGVDIVIGEWGTINGGDVKAQVRQTMQAAKRPSVKGFNYWQFGPSGAGEQLINNDFSKRPHFEDVQWFFKN
jgi:hypothetical protein